MILFLFYVLCLTHLSYPLVKGPFPYKTQQLVVDQVQVLLSSVDDGDNHIMTNGFLRVVGTHFQILWRKNRQVTTFLLNKWAKDWIELKGRGDGNSHDCVGYKTTKTSWSTPVRSRARSGWFMRQWLANFTHSSLTGTWMSLKLEGKHQTRIMTSTEIVRLTRKSDKLDSDMTVNSKNK